MFLWEADVLQKILTYIPKFPAKKIFRGLFFNKVADLQAATSFKNRLWYRFFSCEFCKILKKSFFREHLQTTLIEYSCNFAMSQQIFQDFGLLWMGQENLEPFPHNFLWNSYCMNFGWFTLKGQ